MSDKFPISQDRKTRNQVAAILLQREVRRVENGEPTEPERRAAAMTNTPSPDEDRELIERLNDEAMRLQGRGIDRGCVDSSLAGNLAMEAADRIESLLSDRAKLEHLLCEARLVIRKSGGGDAILNEIDDALNRSTDHTP